MIKGAQKQMIVVRTGDSRYFDEAYFVLRREVKPKRSTRDEMLKEANRILEESGIDLPKRKRLPRGPLLFFAGTVCGILAAVLVCLLLL